MRGFAIRAFKNSNSLFTNVLRLFWKKNNYYPFGLQHQGYNDIANSCRNEEAEAYKLNGKEYEDSFGLNIYEMDMRQLDPAIGRWLVQDPVVHHEFSPYSAFDNNPVFWSDPSGADSETYVTISDLFNKAKSGVTSFEFENGELIGESFAENIEATLQESYSFLEAPTEGGGGGNGDGGGIKSKMAKSLVNVYQKNSKMQMAYSLIAHTIFETTEIGDLSRQAREELIKTYGTIEAQKQSDLIGYMVDILKEIKDQNKGNKYLSDYYVYKASAILILKATALEVENAALKRQIRILDISLYYKYIDPSSAPKGGGFSGGGSGDGWKLNNQRAKGGVRYW